ncbi:MAG: redoxin domain-containing protein [Chitinophagaceae bacterium]|nr:redoxin domain-containing protein [Anaerolineae bacterium]
MRRVLFVSLILAALAGLAGYFRQPQLFPTRIDPQPLYRSALSDQGVAPELLNTAWLNTDKPVRLAALRGQVVLLEFWTFGCINCQNTLPSMQDWYTQYHEKGLAVIGNHYPEYSYERDIQNVAAFLEEREITYPIAQDNAGSTWMAYKQRYWPTIYLIDKVGHIRYRTIGEGNYEEIEAAINDLLAEDYPANVQPAALSDSYISPSQTVNVYLSASQDSEVLGSIGEHMTFIVLDKPDGWYKISYNDREGYVVANQEHLVFLAGMPAN